MPLGDVGHWRGDTYYGADSALQQLQNTLNLLPAIIPAADRRVIGGLGELSAKSVLLRRIVIIFVNHAIVCAFPPPVCYIRAWGR